MTMVTKSTSSDGHQKGRGRPENHPWQAWFQTSGFVLCKGVDYHSRSYIMSQAIRTNAKKYGVRVKISISKDEQSISVLVDRTPHSEEDE